MSDRHLPARVTVMHTSSLHKVENSICAQDGLSGIGERKWCFCSCVGINEGLLQGHNESMAHCHLFDINTLQHLAANDDDPTSITGKYYLHLPVNKQLNGKICRRLLLDTGRPCDTLQLASVTCSYGIPSSVECLDLAVSCLQRMSGSYFINRKLPCLMSMCQCCAATENDKTQRAAKQPSERSSRRKNSRKPCKRDLQTMRDLLSLHSRSKTSTPQNRKSEGLQQPDGRTRSTSKPPTDVSHMSPTHVVRSQSSSTGADVRELSVADHSQHNSSSVNHSDTGVPPDCFLTLDYPALIPAGSPTKKTKSLAARKAADGPASDRRVSTVNKSLAAIARKNAVKHQRKTIAKKKMTRQNSNARQLRSHMSQVLLPANKFAERNRSPRRNCSTESALNTSGGSVAGDSEVTVLYATEHTPSKKTRQKDKHRASAAVLLKSQNSAEIAPESVPDSSQIQGSPYIGNSPSTREANCQDSKLSALSVDTSFDFCNDFCTSPASPLPVNGKSQYCNNVLKSAALLLARKRSVNSLLILFVVATL